MNKGIEFIMKRNEKPFILIKFVILLIISCLGIAFIIFFYSPFFSTNKVSHYFLVSKNVGIDFFGFILPLITIIFCSARGKFFLTHRT